MTRILFGSMPRTNAVRPGLPLARRLVADGHQVTWYTGSTYATEVASTGAIAVPMSPPHDYSDASVARMHAVANPKPGVAAQKWAHRHVSLDPIPGWLHELEALADRVRPQVVVVEHGFLAGLFLAEKLGLPSVAFSTTPLAVPSSDTAPVGTGLAPAASGAGHARNRALNWSYEHVLLADVQAAANGVRRACGLPPRHSFFLNWNVELASRYLAATVPEFEYPRGDLSPHLQFTGPLLPGRSRGWRTPAWWGDVAAARHAGRPVIVLTQGLHDSESHRLLLPAIRGLAAENALVIGCTGSIDPEAVLPRSRRPENLRLERFLPFSEVLPRADVLVTTGGYLGIQQALTAGIPVIVAGGTDETVEVSARVEWAGVGVCLHSADPGAEDVTLAVRRVLGDPRFRRRARVLASRYAETHGLLAAAQAITGLVEPRAASAAPRHTPRDGHTSE
ncbi:glycosyltransferase [Cryobacterium melibiosiphilum]|uniref:Glycosyltransferase n=1 Tax=Cryobacterium melibiosiphilum TaxID=995039 RepID=A0A3A5MC85_9MICO|nr:glycosyltransferase [Cryobacterium melibiosiphilum]RJT85184.1 glycosyltransferase [Cryobacterium melibiosiphilum]